MPPTTSIPRLLSRLLAGATDIRPGEGRPVAACGLLFFLVLFVAMVLRPVREAMVLSGAQEGLDDKIERVYRLFMLTLTTLLVLLPAFGYLVSRVSRRVFLAVSFRLSAIALMVFFLGFTLLPKPERATAHEDAERSSVPAPEPLASTLVIRPEHVVGGIPILSVVVDRGDLLDPERGIIANALERGRKWERPAQVSYFEGTAKLNWGS